jgi:hypothetical protein
MGQSKQWSRLDNAAKIFPPTSSKRGTKVFRFVCELTGPVDGAVLQHALDKTVEVFPLYRSILKKGLFWYYFEESSLQPEVLEESLPVCAPIYDPDRSGLLFRVSYYGKRINLEVFHALADGTGALHFMRTMVFVYLAEMYGITGRLPDDDIAPDQKGLDAFHKYYDKRENTLKAKRYRPFRIRGERLPDNRIGIIEGFLSVRAVLKKAHEHHATLSEFLVSVLICSIYDGMTVRERARPVVITVPVDLRRFFPAQTVRNFFGLIQVTHNFCQDGQEFEQVLAHVRKSFEQQLTKEYLSGIISRYSAMENNPWIKAIPLVIKIPILRLAGFCQDRGDTAAFSNVGRIAMPAEAAGTIRLFDVFLSAKRPQLCLCSFGDTLSVSVSSPLADTGFQRRFFRSLTDLGFSVQMVSNLEQIRRGEEFHAPMRPLWN